MIGLREEALARPTIEEEYRWLSHVWVAFRRSNNREENPEETVREKTRKIVEEHVDVTRVKDDFPIYQIGEDHLEAIRDLPEPAAQAISIAHAAQAHLRPRVDQNPRYKRLSECVQDVLSRWQSGSMSDPEAVEALEDLEREALEIEEEAEDRRLQQAEYALFALLVDDY